MADILTTQSYQDELYSPHITQQSQTSSMQYTNSFQQHPFFPQQQQQPPLTGGNPWFDSDM